MYYIVSTDTERRLANPETGEACWGSSGFCEYLYIGPNADDARRIYDRAVRVEQPADFELAVEDDEEWAADHRLHIQLLQNECIDIHDGDTLLVADARYGIKEWQRDHGVKPHRLPVTLYATVAASVQIDARDYPAALDADGDWNTDAFLASYRDDFNREWVKSAESGIKSLDASEIDFFAEPADGWAGMKLEELGSEALCLAEPKEKGVHRRMGR